LTGSAANADGAAEGFDAGFYDVEADAAAGKIGDFRGG